LCAGDRISTPSSTDVGRDRYHAGPGRYVSGPLPNGVGTPTNAAEHPQIDDETDGRDAR
jgi:hypothetical protein